MAGEGPPAGAIRPATPPRLVVAGTVVALASVVWYALRLTRPIGPPILGWLPVPLNPVLAAVAARTAARRPELVPAARRFWRQFAVSTVFLVAALASQAYAALTHPSGPIAAGTAGLYVATLVPVGYGLVRLPLRRLNRQEWLAIALDSGVVAVAAGIVLWRVALPRVVAANDGELAIWSSIGLVTLTGVVVAVKVSRASHRVIDGRAMWVLGAAVLVGTTTWSLAATVGARHHVDVVMLVVPLAYLGLIVAARVQETACAAPAGTPAPRRAGRPFNPLPYVAVAATDVLVLLVTGRSAPDVRLIVTGSVALTALVVCRQLLAFAQNAQLLDRVDTSLLELGHSEQRFRALIQNSDDIISIIDAAGNLIYNSPSVRRVLGLDTEKVTGVPGHPVVHPADLPVIQDLFAQLAGRPGQSVRGQVRIRHADGSYRWFQVTYTNLLEDRAVRGIVSNARDITDSRHYQDQLAHQATHDDLTGLANRALFAERTERAVADGAPGTVAVALVDLDDFKTINDRLGHVVGDALLVAVAGRLRSCMRPGDMVARLGGDEFGILMSGLPEDASTVVAERVIESLALPVRAGGHQMLVQASIGLVDGEREITGNDLLRRADLAMYAAKDLGKNRYVRYDSDLDARATEHAQLAAALTDAVKREQLHLLYQPIVELPDGRVVGVEALVRWQHPTEGLVPPVRFIPVAERTGLIVPLGAWVLRTACRQAADWQRRYGADAPERISVNVSARQLMEPGFAQTVAAILAETGLPAARLTVEITETAVFGGGRAVETVAALHALGVHIALDDFGTGHSSLGMLRTCPVDVLKVDKSFVDGVTGTVEQEAIATSIVEIAEALGLRAIAEGVETGAQADRLYTLGYTLAQGFHFARPLPPEQVETMFARVPA